MRIVLGIMCVLLGGWALIPHIPKCLRIFLMTSSSSINANIRIPVKDGIFDRPWHRILFWHGFLEKYLQ